MSSTPERGITDCGLRNQLRPKQRPPQCTAIMPDGGLRSQSAIRNPMRAARYYAADDIRIEEVPMPQPGPGEALVATAACGICTGEIVPWYIGRKAPLTPGHEPAGRIVALGPDTPGWQVGERVFVHHHVPCGQCPACRRGASSIAPPGAAPS